MKDRIRQIMESQHMTQQVFADYIQQSPATLSSIFNGRTMFGSGDMYLPQNEGLNEEETTQNGTLQIQNPMLDFDAAPSPTPQNSVQQPQNSNSVRNTRLDLERQEVKTIDKPQRRITEIRVFYDDQTWETFVPQKK